MLSSVFYIFSWFQVSPILFHRSTTGMLFIRPCARVTSLNYYFSIPISPDRPIEVSTAYFQLWFSAYTTQDNYLDAYLRVIKNTDPVRSALVFSCGMGAVRTTFAMVAAVIVRRKMLLARGLEDPCPSRSSFLSNLSGGSYRMGNGSTGISTVSSKSFLGTIP
jgi:hypothetical protein